MGRIGKVLTVVFVSIVLDQGSKVWAKSVFEGQRESCYFDRMFCWIFAENEGAFLGWGSELTGIPFSMILGGGLSNLFDRIAFGKVVDFMNVGVGNLRTGIFNIADMIILAGIIWYFFSNFGQREKSMTETSQTVATDGAEDASLPRE